MMRQLIRTIIPSVVRASIRSAIIGNGDSVAEVAGQIKGRLPSETIKVIFDVGANTGQSVIAYGAAFPGAKIFSFEPDPDTFQQLKNTIAKSQLDAPAFNYALGSTAGPVQFDNTVPSDRRKVVSGGAAGLPSVQVKQLDSIFPTFGISAIDYLKIDTEGHDLDVLKGAKSLLTDGKVKIVETECSVNRDNTHHVSLWMITDLLEGYGYRLFHLFEQAPEWPTGRPNLRRVNAVFISPDVISRNMTPNR